MNKKELEKLFEESEVIDVKSNTPGFVQSIKEKLSSFGKTSLLSSLMAFTALSPAISKDASADLLYFNDDGNPAYNVDYEHPEKFDGKFALSSVVDVNGNYVLYDSLEALYEENDIEKPSKMSRDERIAQDKLEDASSEFHDRIIDEIVGKTKNNELGNVSYNDDVTLEIVSKDGVVSVYAIIEEQKRSVVSYLSDDMPDGIGVLKGDTFMTQVDKKIDSFSAGFHRSKVDWDLPSESCFFDGCYIKSSPDTELGFGVVPSTEYTIFESPNQGEAPSAKKASSNNFGIK